MRQFNLDKKTIEQIIIAQRPDLKNVELTFNTFNNNDGPFYGGGIVTTVKLSGTEMIGDISTSVNENLSIGDIKGYLSKYFEERTSNLRVGEVVFNNGESSRSVGYGLGEHQEKTTYCNGVTVTAFEKDKVKIAKDTSKKQSK